MSIESRFKYHPPKGDQSDTYELIRDVAHDYAKLLEQVCPKGRERSIALTKLEETVMWANASIARDKKRDK